MAGLYRAAYYRVGNLERPINAFKATGIDPFLPTIFDDADFLPSDITDRPSDEADPSTSAPGTQSSSPAHTMTRYPITTPATPLGLPALRISPTHNVTHDILPTSATLPQATPLQATTLPAIPLQATTLPAIPLQATTLPAITLQATTLLAIPLQATTLPSIPLQATTLPAIRQQATTLQAYPMSPGSSSSRVSPAQLHSFPKAIKQGKRRKNARKSEILSGSPYRKLVTDKVGAQSATGKKRSWKKSFSRRDQYRAGPLPVEDEAHNPCHVRPPTTSITARCVEKTTATHPLRTGPV